MTIKVTLYADQMDDRVAVIEVIQRNRYGTTRPSPGTMAILTNDTPVEMYVHDAQDIRIYEMSREDAVLFC